MDEACMQCVAGAATDNATNATARTGQILYDKHS
jgi:hypothetical protein